MGALVLLLLLGANPALAQDEPSHLTIQTTPAQPTAGYRTEFRIRANGAMQLAAELRSADGRERLLGPVLVPAVEGDASLFALSHVFDRPGNFTIALHVQAGDGSSEWRTVPVSVRGDPYQWVNAAVWILLLGLSLALAWIIRRTPGLPSGMRLRRVALAGVFLALVGILGREFFAPLVRDQLAGVAAPDEHVAPLLSALAERDGAHVPPVKVSLAAMPAAFSGVAELSGPLQSQLPAVVTVTVADDKRQPLTGMLSGTLQLVDGDKSAPMAMPPDMPMDMPMPASSSAVALVFHEIAPGRYDTTVWPGQEGSYQLDLHFQAPSTHVMLSSEKLTAAKGVATMHMGHGAAAPIRVQNGDIAFAAGALGLAGGLLAILLLARPRSDESGWSYDLFVWAPVLRFVQSKWFQPILWIPNLIVLALVIYLGIWDSPVGGRNLATTLTWTIWWAAIIFAFVFAGKVWCTMCPFGALTIWTSRVFGAQRKLPPMFRNIWIANFAFIAVTWADAHWGIVSSPRLTALLLILVTLSALAIGYLFERATFCRHLCPIGGLVGIYSMFSGLELRAKDHDICKHCKGKECFAGTPALAGCPMTQFPSTIDRNNYCNLCGECVKACPHQNFALRLRPFAQDIWKTSRRYFDEAFLAIALVALTLVLTGHMVEPWHDWLDRVADWLPFQAIGITGHASIENATFTVVYAVSVLVVAPLLLLGASAVARLLTGGAVSVAKTFRTYAYMFIPLGIGVHLAHNLFHLLKEGPGVVPVIKRTMARFTPLGIGVPNWDFSALASDGAIHWIQMAVMMVFYVASVYLGCRLALRTESDRKTAIATVTPMLILSLAFTMVGVFILSQPMSARHHH